MRDRLETSRLVLRSFIDTDWKSLVSYAGDIDVARATGRLPHPYSDADAENWIAITKTATTDHIYGIANSDDHLIGCISLIATDGGWEFGYWLGQKYWRNGFMREASTALLAEARCNLAPVNVTACVFKDNPRSLAILQYLGFEISGVSAEFCIARNHNVDAHQLTLLLEAKS